MEDKTGNIEYHLAPLTLDILVFLLQLPFSVNPLLFYLFTPLLGILNM